MNTIMIVEDDIKNRWNSKFYNQSKKYKTQYSKRSMDTDLIGGKRDTCKNML
ncbi:hypothetical protein ACWFRC_08885 [Bacillus cereus]